MSEEREPDADEANAGDVVRAAFQRAGVHWLRAGYELLAGVSAFLEELGTRGRDGEAAGGPTRIELDD
jgi:hypothetical protein